MTGVGLGLCYEFLEIHSFHHAPGAASDTFFLCPIGYWSQAIVSFCFALTLPKPWRGAWTKPIVLMLVLSSIFDGLAQGLDFVGQVNWWLHAVYNFPFLCDFLFVRYRNICSWCQSFERSMAWCRLDRRGIACDSNTLAQYQRPRFPWAYCAL